MKHNSGTGKAWHHEHIRERYGRDGTKLLTGTGIWKCTGWNHFTNTQRMWTLAPEVEKVVRHRGAVANTSPAAPQKPQQPKKRGRPIKRAVERLGKRGNRAPNMELISTAPNVDIKHVESELNSRDDLTATTKTQLQAVLNGEINTTYRQGNHGRIQGQGIHYQNFTKQAKKICFPNDNEIDIENCHPSIIAQLAHQLGIETPALDDYISNKQHWRELIATQTGIGIGDVKSGLISLCFSAQRSTSDKTSIVKKLGKEKAAAFNSHSKVKALHDDLRRSTKAIVKDARKNANRLGNIKNACELPLHKTEKPKKIMAHIVQGLESHLIQHVILELGCEVQVSIHDAIIITESITPNALKNVEQEIQKQTGFIIKLSVEPMTEPDRTTTGEGRERAPLTGSVVSNPLFYVNINVLNYGSVRSEKNTQNTASSADQNVVSGNANDPPERPPP